MALDTQPLSRSRQAVMLLVMLALLAASLGFAQVLVRRQVNRPTYSVLFAPPPGLTDPVPPGELIQGWSVAYQGLLNGLPRRMVCFSLAEREVTEDVDTWGPVARDLFTQLTGSEVEEQLPIKTVEAGLAGRRAVEIGMQFGTGEQTVFTVLRATGVEGRMAAICFSGVGPYTLADKAYMNTYCAQDVEIRAQSPRTGK